MSFRTNLSRTERLVRLLGGALLIGAGLAGLHASAAGLALAAAGLAAMLTGAIRYCPACALAGRKDCA